MLQKPYSHMADRIGSILTELIDCDEGGTSKPSQRWYRDLIMAAELGAERDWNLLRALINVDRLQRDLRQGLAALLSDRTQPLPTAERVHAGFLLGKLGDNRFPVEIHEWQREIESVVAGRISGYFCRVNPEPYIIGSNNDDPHAADSEKPQHTVTLDEPFWIGRFPITNAQWQEWVRKGGDEPLLNVGEIEFDSPNQPANGVAWGQSWLFCKWLSQVTGMTIRLPTEYEWEAAARGSDARCYPWGVVFQKWRRPRLHRPSKGISVHKQANDNVVHLRGFREADRLADQAFDTRP